MTATIRMCRPGLDLAGGAVCSEVRLPIDSRPCTALSSDCFRDATHEPRKLSALRLKTGELVWRRRPMAPLL